MDPLRRAIGIMGITTMLALSAGAGEDPPRPSGEGKRGATGKKRGRKSTQLLTCSLTFRGAKRQYFLRLPADFQPNSFLWPMVVVHGGVGGARTNSRAIAMRRLADEQRFPAIVISPEFITKDKQVSRFPVLGEADFLKAVLKDVRKDYKLRPKILLMGYSMGGQFAHRFTFANPGLVQACAALAAGSWSTPDGRLLIETYGEVKDPGSFLASKRNAAKVPERLHNLFETRTAGIAGLPATKGANKVPFLVMCGTLDPRLSIAKAFVAILKKAGFTVGSEWPRTPHGMKARKYKTEFEKYPKRSMAFFIKHAKGK